MGSLAALCIEKCAGELSLNSVELPEDLRIYYERGVRHNEMKKLLTNVNVAQTRFDITELLNRKNASTKEISSAISEIIPGRNYMTTFHFKSFDRLGETLVEFRLVINYVWSRISLPSIDADIFQSVIISSRKATCPRPTPIKFMSTQVNSPRIMLRFRLPPTVQK